MVVIAFLNVLALVLVLVVNALANILPINGVSTGELSDRYPNLFVPAGFTFSIWGLIYLLLTAYVVYQLVVVLRSDPAGSKVIATIGPLFVLSCLANAGWIFAWHYQRVFLSVLIMLLLLGTLIALYVRLGVGTREAPASVRYLVRLPFSVYLGWITVATVANVTALLVNAGWGGFGLPDALWAVAMIIAASLITVVMILRRGDAAYALVVVWALFGIFMKRMSTDPQETVPVIIATAVCGVLLLILIVVRLMQRA